MATLSTSTSEDILSWTNEDTRESVLFNSQGVLYRFKTADSPIGQTVTQLWRAIRANKEERIAKLEWSPNGGLGRVTIGKEFLPMCDLVRPHPQIYGGRTFTAPDGLQYQWTPSTSDNSILLQDAKANVIAFFRPTRPTRYQIGEVFGELHLLRKAGMGTVMHPPMTDMVILTAMLYRFCAAFNL